MNSGLVYRKAFLLFKLKPYAFGLPRRSVYRSLQLDPGFRLYFDSAPQALVTSTHVHSAIHGDGSSSHVSRTVRGKKRNHSGDFVGLP